MKKSDKDEILEAISVLNFKMENQFRDVYYRLDNIDVRFDKVFNSLDFLHSEVLAIRQELVFMNHRYDRRESWISQLAHNTKAKLAPPVN